MTDYTELKRLAEAASNREWHAADWSNNFGEDKTTIEFHTEEVVAPGNHGIWPNRVACHQVASTGEGENPLADAAFIAAANPVAVLALIAENERLQSASRTLERLRYTDNGGDLWKPPLGEKPDFNLMDKLKVENEALRKAFRPLLAHWDDLKAGESLNVDAARAAMGKGEQS